jgi:hypothetical protein
VSPEGSPCETRFTAWLAQNARDLGRTYVSEIERNYSGRHIEVVRAHG